MESEQSSTVIDLAELRRAIDAILDHIMITRGVSHVRIESPLYWTLLSGQARSVDETPSKLGIGNLNEDLAFVLSVLRPDHQPFALVLAEVAPVLSYVAEVVSEQLANQGG